MWHILRSSRIPAFVLLPLLAAAAATAQPVLPDFSAALFDNSLQIDNPFFPLIPGSTYTYDAVNTDPDTGEEETEVILVEVLYQTRNVAGIEARVVRDRVYLEGLLIEDTFDWYTQDNVGNVWYVGEDVTDFEYDDEGNLIGTSHPGAWETGVDGALPGYLMEAHPQVDDHYYQEFYPGEAEDHARVLGLNEMHTVPAGSFEGVLHTRDFSLDLETYGEKFYAPGVGTILEHDYDAETGELLGTAVLRSMTVPEPSALLMAALATMALLMARRQAACRS